MTDERYRIENSAPEDWEYPPFDPESFMRVGAWLLDAATLQPALGLRLERALGRSGLRPPYWFVGTQVTSGRDARRGDFLFTTYTPRLGDLAKRMENGDFAVWLDGLAEGYAAGLLHPVRPNAPARAIAQARLALEVATAAMEPIASDCDAGNHPVRQARRPPTTPDPSSAQAARPLHFDGNVAEDARIVRRSRR